MPTLQAYLYADVVQGGTVSANYPAGFTLDNFDKAGAKVCLLSPDSAMPAGSYSLAWGASAVVITNNNGVWKAGVSLFVAVPDVVNAQGEHVTAFVDPVTGGISLSVAGKAVTLNTDIKTTTGMERTFNGASALTSAGYTIFVQRPALGPFCGVQFVYENKTASAITIDLVKVAAVPTDGADGVTGSPTWVPVTFAGSASASIPAATSGGGTDDAVPGLLISDMIQLSSVARTDTPANQPLIQIRTYAAAAQPSVALGTSALADVAAANPAEQWGSRIVAGDQVTSISALAPLRTGQWLSPFVANFQYATKAFTLACAGDSLTQGQGSSSSVLGWPKRAEIALQSPGALFSVANFARTNQHHAAIALTAKAIIANLKPQALAFPAFSPNDGAGTQALMDASWFRTLELIELCRKANIIPIVFTSGAVNSYNLTAADTKLKAQNAKVRLLPCTILDFEPIINDPSSPGLINSAYNSGDGIHYNDACYTAMATYAAGVLAAII